MVIIIMIILATAIISASVFLYIRSATIGPPIKVQTFTEYKWASYFPSASLFYLSYSDEDMKTLYQIAKLDDNFIMSREEFGNGYGAKIAYWNRLNNKLKKIEEFLSKEGKTYIIKDAKGVRIVIGMPKKYLKYALPEVYPYICTSEYMPVFYNSDKNLRVQLSFCCTKIKICEDYIAAPGREECITDPCEVGPCRIMYCSQNPKHPSCLYKNESERVCVENSRPSVEFFVQDPKSGEWVSELTINDGTTVTFKVDISDDSKLKRVSIYYKSGIFGEELVSPSDDIGVYYYEDLQYTYDEEGRYIAKIIVEDDDGVLNKKEITINVI